MNEWMNEYLSTCRLLKTENTDLKEILSWFIFLLYTPFAVSTHHYSDHTVH